MSTASTTSRFGTMGMAMMILSSMMMTMTSMVMSWHQWWWNGKETSEFLPLRAPQGRLEKRVPKLTIVTISKLSLFRCKPQTIFKGKWLWFPPDKIQPPHYGTATRIIKSNTVTTGHDDMSPTFTLHCPSYSWGSSPMPKQSGPAPKKYLGHRRNLSNQYDLLTFNP